MRLAASVLALLAACGPAPVLLDVPEADPGARVPTSLASVEVVEVSLPTYAEGEDIFVRAADGTLAPLAGAVLADDPARALTLDLARALGAVTGALVVPEPWPFEDDPAARLDVRVSRAVVDAGAFVLAGQAFLGETEEDGRAVALPFRVSVPLAGPDPASIAAARAQATALLAREIAERGL